MSLPLNSLSKHLSTITRTASVVAKHIKCTAYGQPGQNMTVSDVSLAVKKPKELLLKMLAAAVNPSDINTIQGKYGKLPERLPTTIGNEGVFEVVDGGSESTLKPGEKVIALTLGLGTWCSHMLVNDTDVHKVDNRLSNEAAATLLVNPVTAYLMLHSIVDVRKGDSVIFNAPTSSVGQALIQLCKNDGIFSICVVRDKDMDTDVTKNLERLGASMIRANSDLVLKDKWKSFKKPKLALNAVGGKDATNMMRVVDNGCTMVTYGGLSLQPVTVPVGSLIFRNQKFIGFWLSAWRDQNKENGKLESIVDELSSLIIAGKLEPPMCEGFKLSAYQDAIEHAMSPGKKTKTLLIADE